MKKYTYILLLLSLFSCRPVSDELLSYGQNDNQVYSNAKRNFTEEFKSFWLAMNENYSIWDYEYECGLDWDQVYETYLPKFKELDDTTKHKQVTNNELYSLYSQFVDSLHDGHIQLKIKNLHTGKYITLNPGQARNKRERGEQFAIEGKYITNLNVYSSDYTNPKYRIIEYDNANANTMSFEHIARVLNLAKEKTQIYIEAIDKSGGPNQLNDSIYESAKQMLSETYELDSILNSTAINASLISKIIPLYNTYCDMYYILGKQIGVVLSKADANLAESALKSIEYSLFDGNILYLRLSAFGLTPNLVSSMRTADTTSMLYSYQLAVDRVWQRWFRQVQQFSNEGSLGGIILDVRNNGGGYVNDYQFVLGALLPAGGYNSHVLRVKNGVGRYDFSPLMNFVVPTLEQEHAVVSSAPIVVLANSRSGSMAENTAWGVTQQPNGCFIGTRTYGALSALNTNPADYSATYSGAFGEENVTAIYGYIPKYVCLYGNDHHPIEGVGVIPDIQVPLDTTLFVEQGRDNQLEAAIDYIRKD